MGASLSSTLLERLAMLALPWVGGELIRVLAGGGGGVGGTLSATLALALALFVAVAVLRYCGEYFGLRAGEATIVDMHGHLYDRLQALRIDYFHRRPLGETLALFENDLAWVTYYVTHSLAGAIPSALTVTASFAVMFWHDAVLGACALACVPLVLVGARLLGRTIRRRTLRSHAERAAAAGIVQENLGAIATIHTFAREADESGRYRHQLRGALDAVLAQQRGLLGVNAVAFVVSAACSVVIVGIGSARVVEGSLSASELVSVLLYGFVLIRPMADLAQLYSATQRARGSAERLARVFSAPLDAAAQERPCLPPGPGRVEFDRVVFAYPGSGDEPVIKGLTLTIEAGECVALVGPNGAGKTTLFQLLLSFYAPQDGRVLLDGADVTQVSARELRQAVALVGQQPELFARSVRENILYGRPAASQAEVEAAARTAGAHDFVVRLPGGYDADVGPQGIRLSAGQRQRLCLARALLTDPRVLLLDEPTAMFDPEAEEEFIAAARSHLRERTVIVVTHRPRLLALAERVVRIDAGQITSVTRPHHSADETRLRQDYHAKRGA